MQDNGIRLIRRGQATFSVTNDETYRTFWDAFESGEWERETLDVFTTHVNSDTFFIDVGSWIGPISLYVANFCRQVVCVEPDPIAAAALRANVALNPDLSSKIEILEAAVSRDSGSVKIGSRAEGGDSMSSSLFADQKTAWVVPTVLPSTLLKKADGAEHIFVKMDIEGGEYEVFPDPAWTSKKLKMALALHPRFIRKQTPFLTGIRHRVKMRYLIANRAGERFEKNSWFFDWTK